MLEHRADDLDGLEEITQKQHALQAATIGERQGAPDARVVAARESERDAVQPAIQAWRGNARVAAQQAASISAEPMRQASSPPHWNSSPESSVPANRPVALAA